MLQVVEKAFHISHVTWGLLLLIILILWGCGPKKVYLGDRENDESQIILPASLNIPSAESLQAEQSLSTFQLPSGFIAELVAAEPLIQAPIEIEFDEKGRLWVLEMYGYMSDIEATEEEAPVGRILILTDEDGDGKMDQSRIFLDSLKLARAFCLLDGGILYAEPPNLWFSKIDNDQPVSKTLVDSVYATGGNVEHQPNTLLLGLDNWIYSAKSRFRYRKIGDDWLKEETVFRGQWGMSQDDEGRLFYNTNSNQLRGDFIYPTHFSEEALFPIKRGVNEEIAKDQRVYPSRITPGVNRGYRAATLDENWKLRHFTAACSPFVYRGTNFPKEYYGNVFVAEPSANLVKQNILLEQNGRIRAIGAHFGGEFLNATDERFRPVNFAHAPDGSMYMADFYRGIVQHKTYMTGFLYKQVVDRKLDQHVDKGRIYRIRYEGKELNPVPDLSQASLEELTAALSHPNAWHRETTQRLLIERKTSATADEMRKVLSSKNTLAKIHALWVLEGIEQIAEQDFFSINRGADERLIVQALRIAEAFKENRRLRNWAKNNFTNHPSKRVQFQLLQFLMNNSVEVDRREVLKMVDGTGVDPIVENIWLHAISGREQEVLEAIESEQFSNTILKGKLSEALLAKKESEGSQQIFSPEDQKVWDTGKEIYAIHCSGCHQMNGNGREPLAPPLNKSEWVTGSPEVLGLIVLNGMRGPVEVNGVVYQPPMIQKQMPGIGQNPAFTDEKVAAVLSFVRNSWNNQASFVRPEEVEVIREKAESMEGMFTQEQLLQLGKALQ
ncbi:MAG: c-type cytochrome [Bacteroidota bacterium]